MKNLTNPDRMDVLAAIGGNAKKREGVLAGITHSIAAPFVRRAQSKELESIIARDMLAMRDNKFKPLGRLKNVFVEPDNIPVENLEALKSLTGLPVPMISWPHTQTSSATGQRLHGAPPIGLSEDDEHIVICQRLGQLPALVDPRARPPAPKLLLTGGAQPDEDWRAPMVQQDARLLSSGTITIAGGWRYHAIFPVTQIGVYGVDGIMYSIGFAADGQGRHTTLLYPAIDEMPVSVVKNWPAFLVYGKWQASTMERRDQSFHGAERQLAGEARA